MAVINSGMRKTIKIMAVTAQTAQFLSLMPKPKDFATRLVGDVVYLSSRVTKLSEDVNRLLDQYASIPTDYIMSQMNSITGSASRIVDRVSTYAQNAVDQTLGLASSTMDLISGTTSAVIDAVKETSNAVISLGGTVAHAGSSIIGRTDIATDIHDGVEVILEWNGEKFDKVIEESTKPLDDATRKVNDTIAGVNTKIENKADDIKDDINKPKEFLENILSRLKASMDKLSADFDSSFPLTQKISEKSLGVADALADVDESNMATEAAMAVATSVGDIFKNFSIAKVVKAFGGVLIQTGIVELGLNELPPIDFETMLSNVRGNLESDITFSEKQYLAMASDVLGRDVKDMNDLSEELKNEVIKKYQHYSAKEYNAYKRQFNEQMREKRNEIIEALKEERESQKRMKREEKDKVRDEKKLTKDDSVISEQRKLRKQAKAAKQLDKFTEVLKKEIMNVKDEFKARSNEIQSDWKNMMDRYDKAIDEIKMFFQTGGDGDMFIDDICDRINQDCDAIKELCKNLIVQLTTSAIKVAMPSDIGPVVPNPAYKIADFLIDIKIIIKFIKDLITLVIDIINCINKLARIMLNGINNLKTIIDQLMEILGIKWFMDLIQSIIDLFGEKIKDSRELMENMLCPVYYYDTEEYDNTMEALEELVDDKGEISKDFKGLISTKRYYSLASVKKDELKKTTKVDGVEVTKYEQMVDALEKKGDEIVAYKSVILDEPLTPTQVPDLVDGKSMEGDFKFIGWHFFHPTLRTDSKDGLTYSGGKIFNKIKNKIIKKAAKTGYKRKGGIKGLNEKWKVKGKAAYNAFYWYTYYTLDLEKDCYVGRDAIQGKIYIDNVVQQQNGSIVELTDGRKVFVKDNMVRSGDYVSVNGVKYRVK